MCCSWPAPWGTPASAARGEARATPGWTILELTVGWSLPWNAARIASWSASGSRFRLFLSGGKIAAAVNQFVGEYALVHGLGVCARRPNGSRSQTPKARRGNCGNRPCALILRV